MALRDHIPAPSIEQLTQLQLMRYTLVKFIDWKNFDEVIQGCYVRVLLEMRTERQTTSSTDSYYIAAVKGAQKGPAYTGFSWDGLSTEWHIVIELPPCFRSAPNNNVVQFNSISNSPFKKKEYQEWVQMSREAQRPFITAPQIDLRLNLLNEHYQMANIALGSPGQGGGKRSRRNNVELDPEKQAAREAAINQMKLQAQEEIRREHIFLPEPDSLCHLKQEQLLEVQRQCLELAAQIRNAISERSKCIVCKKKAATVVFWPCRHQATCKDCSMAPKVCPVDGCDAEMIADRFEPFTS